MTEKPKQARRALSARAPKVEARVAVPCLSCGRATSMRVPAELLARVDILHLCPSCARS